MKKKGSKIITCGLVLLQCFSNNDFSSQNLVNCTSPSVSSIVTSGTSCGYGFNYLNKYSKIQTYVPDSNSPIKTIKVALHFFQKTDGSNMWQDNAITNTLFTNAINDINNKKANNAPPTWTIAGVPFIQDVKFRYELTGIYFYKDDALNSFYSVGDASPLENAIMAADPNRLKSIPICFTDGLHPGSSGYALFPTTNFSDNSYVVISNNGSAGNAAQGTIDHELGHCIDLYHTYDSENMYKLQSEYLSDVFNVGWGNYCTPPSKLFMFTFSKLAMGSL